MVYHISPWPTYSEVAQLCPTLCEPIECPWNSPGQDTGVGSLSFLQGIFPNPGIKPRSPTLHVDSLPIEPQRKPKNAGVSSLSLLQWIFLTQESNKGQGFLHCRRILHQLSHKGSPRILEWEAYLLSSGSSWPRNRTVVSCIAGKFFTSWVTREALQEVGDVSINDSLESKLICCWKN